MSLAVARRSVAIGDVLEGRYRIVAKLAEGGMGTVYLAQHTRIMATDIERTQPMVVGTPEFMAPEQITAPETVDHRTDVYALGACLYEMLTARTPFSGEDLRVLLHRVVNEPPPPLDDDVPAELGDAVMRMLAKRPSDRYTSMRAVIEDLRAIAQDLKDVVLLTPAMRKDEPYSELVLKRG